MKPHSVTDKQAQNKPSREQAEKAVETLIRYAGEDPERAELLKTPKRFVKAMDEHFKGYSQDPSDIFGSQMEDAGDYNDFVLLTDIDIHSHCQHHLHPIIGKAHIAYWPDGKLAGLSKFVRLVNIFAKRMVSQETLTADIRNAIDIYLKPKGSAVIIEAAHLCMSTRGITQPDVKTHSASYSGVFEKDVNTRQRFLDITRHKS